MVIWVLLATFTDQVDFQANLLRHKYSVQIQYTHQQPSFMNFFDFTPCKSIYNDRKLMQRIGSVLQSFGRYFISFIFGVKIKAHQNWCSRWINLILCHKRHLCLLFVLHGLVQPFHHNSQLNVVISPKTWIDSSSICTSGQELCCQYLCYTILNSQYSVNLFNLIG